MPSGSRSTSGTPNEQATASLPSSSTRHKQRAARAPSKGSSYSQRGSPTDHQRTLDDLIGRAAIGDPLSVSTQPYFPGLSRHRVANDLVCVDSATDFRG